MLKVLFQSLLLCLLVVVRPHLSLAVTITVDSKDAQVITSPGIHNGDDRKIIESHGLLNSGATVNVPNVPYYPSSNCSGFISVCGKNIAAPTLLPGGITSLTVPKPYLPQSFTAQCISSNGQSSYQIINAADNLCTLPTCAAGSINVCGTSIPIDTAIQLGKSIRVTIPRNVLADGYNRSDLSFDAVCADNGDAAPTYQMVAASAVSCNLFPCQESRLHLCEATIAIPGGQKMGSVLHLSMPPPFQPEPFTVQCIGSQGNSPVYQVTDHDHVTCEILPEKP